MEFDSLGQNPLDWTFWTFFRGKLILGDSRRFLKISIPYHGRLPYFTLPLPSEFQKWAISPCPWNSIVINITPPPPPTVNKDEGRFLSHITSVAAVIQWGWGYLEFKNWGGGGLWKSVNIPKYLLLFSLFPITIQKRGARQLIFFGTTVTNKPTQMTPFKSLQW